MAKCPGCGSTFFGGHKTKTNGTFCQLPCWVKYAAEKGIQVDNETKSEQKKQAIFTVLAFGFVGGLFLWVRSQMAPSAEAPQTKFTGYLVVNRSPSGIAAKNEAAYNEYTVHSSGGEKDAITAMFKRGELVLLKSGTRLWLEDSAVGYRKVRVDEGPLAGQHLLVLSSDVEEEKK